jgi:tetratricopeptide (TPR) repeat protein
MPALSQRLGMTRFEADEYYRQALDAYARRDLGLAVDQMNYAIELLPTKSEYFAARGFFQLEDAAYDEAEKDFARALAIFPYEMLAHYGRGVIAYRNKDLDTALAHFTEAYRADPNRGETLYYLGMIYLAKGDPVSALDLMVRAQKAFEAAGDKRKSNADRMVRELGKLAQKTAGVLAKQAGNTGA